MSAPTFSIRPITNDDDDRVADIIRTVMPQFGAGGAGFAINDPEVAAMSRAYDDNRSIYLVVENRDGVVVGGGGIAPLSGGDADTCELRKMYFLDEIRGVGVGRALLTRLLDEARRRDFRVCYLETLTGMDAAMALYRKLGFVERQTPCGATGHFSCDKWFELVL